MGRPPTRAIRFRDGFYIEVRSKGASSGVKIRSDDFETMMNAAKDYQQGKEVTILGEHKKGKWVNEEAENEKKASDKKLAKKAAKLIPLKSKAPAKAAPVAKKAKKK
jgi:hypothetical protein